MRDVIVCLRLIQIPDDFSFLDLFLNNHVVLAEE